MKKFLAMLLIAMMAFSFVSVAFACHCGNDELIKRVDQANAKIEQYVLIAKMTPYNDVPWLLHKINQTVKPVMDYAARIGATVVCEIRNEYIDGQWVEIDPLHVVNLGDDDNDNGKK